MDFLSLKLVVAGHVDHGKSTLIGRLMQALGLLPEEKIEAVRVSCAARGMPFEWAFVMDALRVERAQGITLETAHIVLKTPRGQITLMDAPGHHELLKNMITGAHAADGALLVIDAAEGISEQTRRHTLLLQLLGIRQLILVVNKMDKVGYQEARYRELVQQMTAYGEQAGLSVAAAIPVAAQSGEGLTQPSAHMPWYRGEPLIDAMFALSPHLLPSEAPLRALVQDVYRREDKRLLAVRVARGQMRVGEALTLLPSGARATLASIESWPKEKAASSAAAGEAVVITLAEPVLAERGMVLTCDKAPPLVGNRFRARIFWLGGSPLALGETITIEIGTARTSADITAIEQRHDAMSQASAPGGEQVAYGEIAQIVLRTRQLLALEDAPSSLGRMAIIRGGVMMGGGTIATHGFADLRATNQMPKSSNLHAASLPISTAEREAKSGHQGLVVWLTGLSSSGKSTLASGAARRLFDKGYQVTILDGDHLRAGLCRDLGFSPQDRSENIRRSGEVAALMAEAGLITIAAFISPTAKDRASARSAAPSRFHLVHVSASLEACQKRDAKGLYRRAREGAIKEFTGISAPYEPPQDAELVIDTEAMNAQNAIDMLCSYIEKHARLP